jgi:ABC-type molybdate transport system substrate-binding protein
MIELPRKFAITSAYYIAVLNGSNQAIGSKYMAFVMSPKGQRLLKDDGFITPTK